MNRTKLSFQAVILMLVCASGLALTSCGKKEQESQHENAQLVKRAFERLNENDTKGLLALVTTDNSDRGDKQVLGGYLWADDIKIEVDDDIYPDEVYYECVIPNPLVAMLNNIYDRVFINHKRSNLSEMFASMSISGFFTIETDPKTGKKQINIDDSNNPFSIYLDIVYNTDLDERYDVNKLTNNENASVIIATVSYTVTSIYSDLVADDYFFDTFIPDMTTFFKDNDLQTLLKVAETMKETKDEIAINITDNGIDYKQESANKGTATEREQEEIKKAEEWSKKNAWWFVISLSFIAVIVLLLIACLDAILPERASRLRAVKVKKMTNQHKLKKIALKDSYWKVREEAVKRITDQDILKQVTLLASDRDVCKTAFKKITDIDKTFFKEVALKASSWEVRMAAVKKITDQVVLKEVALKDSDIYVRIEAVKKITDQDILKEVALKASYSDVREEAVKKITDQDILKEVALKDSDSDVREEAVKKITDQDILKEVALKDSSWEVRMAAVKNITDQDILKEVALKDSYSDVREEAVKRITDQDILKQVTLLASDRDVCKTAFKKITDIDKTFFKEVALKASSWEVRMAAVKKITDQVVLKEVALKDSDIYVRIEAVKKITDQDILKEVALKDSDGKVREVAVKGITDQVVLKEVALKDSDGKVREVAVKGITDQVVLKEVALKDSDSDVRIVAVKKITDQKILKEITLLASDSDVCKMAVKKITDQVVLKEVALKASYSDVREEAVKRITDQDILKEILTHRQQPIREEMPIVEQVTTVLHYSNDMSEDKKKSEIEHRLLSFGKTHDRVILGAEVHYSKSDTSSEGWTLAALGKLIADGSTPEKVKLAIEDFEKRVSAPYDKDVQDYNNLLEQLKTLESDLLHRQNVLLKKLSKTKIDKFKKLKKDFEKIQSRIERGILAYAADAGVLPFAFFMQVITDSQNRFGRFVRQGAIMGMIDFFMKYKDNEIIKPYYESLIAARRDMISSDSKMSFFEVRAPKLCTAKEYAEVLKEVLRCANPSIKYCDTERLMEIAEEEIPGIMDLLVNYPLRLIDPANQEEEGFYEFEPYRHAMWVRYTPPLNVGPVIDRYHEVLDMTLPNSSGLNIRLFTDPYAVIPVLFHEYCHYMEDPNEASVFLRTYAFSLKFYKKYRDANPEKDFAYVKLHEILGKSINPDNYNELNKLILQYYGEPESQAEAIKSANADLNNKNFYIHLNNQQQKWCPEIKMPLLNEDGDKTNADLIKRIRLRYAQVPRTITKDEFNIKKGTYQPVTQEVHQMYYKDQINFFDQSISNIKYSSKWRSFKNFCIDKGYITRYKGNDDYDTNSQSPSISADAMKDLIKKLEASGIDIDTAMKYLRGNKKLWI